MFRSPNLAVARAKRKSGWETYTQRAKAEVWLRSRGLTPPNTADECWELVVNTLTKPLLGDE